MKIRRISVGFLLNTYWGKILSTFLVSMVPVIELRGAIPFATAQGLGVRTAIAASVLGNMVPVPFIIIFIRKIFDWLRTKSEKLDRLVRHFEENADKHAATVNRYRFWGLFVLVAIPLPGTGAWTGALVAAMLDMRLKSAVPSILMGVIAAAVIVALLSYGAAALIF